MRKQDGSDLVYQTLLCHAIQKFCRIYGDLTRLRIIPFSTFHAISVVSDHGAQV